MTDGNPTKKRIFRRRVDNPTGELITCPVAGSQTEKPKGGKLNPTAVRCSPSPSASQTKGRLEIMVNFGTLLAITENELYKTQDMVKALNARLEKAKKIITKSVEKGLAENEHSKWCICPICMDLKEAQAFLSGGKMTSTEALVLLNELRGNIVLLKSYYDNILIAHKIDIPNPHPMAIDFENLDRLYTFISRAKSC